MRTKILIFGVTGDLSRRKLLPSLNELIRVGAFDDVEVIGVSRHELDMKELVGQYPDLAPCMRSVVMSMTDEQDYETLKRQVLPKSDEQLMIYLSVPPAASGQLITRLGEAGINTPNVKLLVEKPFGVDLASAKEAIRRIDQYFREDQVYRIDHYLAKEMAQNIVVFREENPLFANIWNHHYIEHIEVLATEQIDIEGRGVFYEQTGALRDLVQGHLMQLLSLVLMRRSQTIDWASVPARRLEAIEQLIPADAGLARRAQYVGYRDEADAPYSNIETFVAVELYSSDPAWAGVPMRLITGKAMSMKRTEIRLYLKRRDSSEPYNCLVFQVHPEEGVRVDVVVKRPGYERQLQKTQLVYMYDQDGRLPEAYEQVLVDAALGRHSLFTSGPEVLAAWEVLQPLLDAWSMSEEQIELYQKGTHYSDLVG